MPLNCIQSHHLHSAPRQTRAMLRCGRGVEALHPTYKWSWILQATKPRLPLDQFICGKFTARLTKTKCLLTAPSSFAMLSALPWAKATLLHLRQFVPSPLLCPLPLFHRSIGGKSAPASALAPLGGLCCRPRLGCIRYIFTALFCGISVRDCTTVSSDTLRRSLHCSGCAKFPRYRRGPRRLQHHE